MMSVSTNHLEKKQMILDLSIVQRNTRTLQACNHVYDNYPPSFLDTSELFYESRAIYENPVMTATSRALIADIHSFMRRLCIIDVPRPVNIFKAIVGKHPIDDSKSWFRVLRMWSEIDDISETESFDGQKKSLVEHTLNILLFPDIHSTYNIPSNLSLNKPPSPSEGGPSFLWAFSAMPSLPVPGTSLALPSPLYFQLPIMTRLSFNEQGLITYHRDVWDIRDVLRLVPGVRMALWFLARATAWVLAWVGRQFPQQFRNGPAYPAPVYPT
ncbi:hypothetical protein V8B97DRAFT_850147 [Scleroderma yunnanense]